MAIGFLRVQSFAARLSAPVPAVDITVVGADFTTNFLTDAEGNAPDLGIPAPDASYSLDEDNTTVLPYAVCALRAFKPGYQPITIEGIQIFDGQVTLSQLELTPVSADAAVIAEEPVIIPVHSLFAGNGGSGPAPVDDGSAGRILPAVIIPKNITVHLGKPAAVARDVTVSFRNYIANVASSEVYPTWAVLHNPIKTATLSLSSAFRLLPLGDIR